jgi:hypothetical protein
MPAIVLGCYLLSCWVRIHTADVFYVEYPHLLAACMLVGMGVLGACCSVYGALRRSFYGLMFLVPIALSLATMVYIPGGNASCPAQYDGRHKLPQRNGFLPPGLV